jgi:hypothetical protein
MVKQQTMLQLASHVAQVIVARNAARNFMMEYLFFSSIPFCSSSSVLLFLHPP